MKPLQAKINIVELYLTSTAFNGFRITCDVTDIHETSITHEIKDRKETNLMNHVRQSLDQVFFGCSDLREDIFLL